MSSNFWFWVTRILLFVAFGYILNAITNPDYDDSDDEINKIRSGLEVHTDHKTGCQYLSTLIGGLTPRADVRGEQVGCRN